MEFLSRTPLRRYTARMQIKVIMRKPNNSYSDHKTKLLMKYIIAQFILMTTSITCFAQEPPLHILGPGNSTNLKTSEHKIIEKILKSTKMYKNVEQLISRAGFSDIAFPKDIEEFRKMKGWAILLITTLTKDQNEHPTKRAYIEHNGKEIKVVLMKSASSEISEDHPQILKTFGKYRMDALYLFPAFFASLEAYLKVDFAVNRDGFLIKHFPLDSYDGYSLSSVRPSTDIDQKALKEFLDREFPVHQSW